MQSFEGAACVEEDPRTFFPYPQKGPQSGPAYEPALRVCERCPITTECLEFALRTRQLEGVWGGTTPEKRRMMSQHLTDAARR